MRFLTSVQDYINHLQEKDHFDCKTCKVSAFVLVSELQEKVIARLA